MVIISAVKRGGAAESALQHPFIFGKEAVGPFAPPGHMRFRPFKLKALLPYLSAALIYPVIALITSDQKLLKFIDALTITGFVFLILGIIGNLTRHGDFDIMEFIARRSLKAGDKKTFAAFKDDKEQKRKDSANYPFLTGIILIAVSALLAVIFY